MEEESRVPGDAFAGVFRECVSTFMWFLKKDKESCWRVFRERMRRRLSCGGDNLLYALIKMNEGVRSLSLSLFSLSCRPLCLSLLSLPFSYTDV